MPSLLILSCIVIVPIAMSFYFSLTNYSVLSPGTWVGGANYLRLLSDPAFLGALENTAVYTLIAVPAQTIMSLIIAETLAKRFKSRLGGFVRSALFIPVISSFVLVGIVWRFILGTDNGMVNHVVTFLGGTPVNWLGESTLALLSISVVTVWKNIGYFLVIYYAGIMDIPGELYEASAIDGASPIRQFLYITIPALKPVTLFVVMLGTIWSFQVFDLVYTMTGGGPGGATVTLVVALYQIGFQNMQMGYASAIAIVLFLIVLAIAIVQRRILSRGE